MGYARIQAAGGGNVIAPGDRAAHLESLITSDFERMGALRAVASLSLTDCWIAAGFVRDAVWASLHSFDQSPSERDVDVVWFNSETKGEKIDKHLTDLLARSAPEFRWSVKNQARMHRRNGDKQYRSVEHAMTFWPETATAIAVRIDLKDSIEICAPFGLDDLYNMVIRPTANLVPTKRGIFDERVASKQWLDRFPKLSLARG